MYIKITKKPSEKRDPMNPFAVHLVNPYFKKNHVELFHIFFKARVVFYELAPIGKGD